MTRAEPLNGRRLRLDADPFTPTATNHHLTPQVQTAFREMVRQLLQQAPLILITGPASTGKTLLVDMTTRLCRDMGLSARRVDRGDLLHMGLDSHCDVLLVDEANSVEDRILETFSPERRSNAATTTVFLGLPSCLARFVLSVDPVLIELDLLSRSDAECYLRECATTAGFTDLFSDDALDLIVNASNGSPRLLRRIASEAFFNAASDGAFHIGHKHAASVLAMQLPSNRSVHQEKQTVAAEGTLFAQARIDDDRFVREKASSQIDGALALAETVPEGTAPATTGLNLTDPAPAVRQNEDGLDDDIWIGATDEISPAPWAASNRRSVTPTLVRRGAVVVCTAIAVAAAVLVIIKPWIGTAPVSSNLPASSNLTVSPPSQPVAVGPSGGSESAPPLIAPSEVENTLKPEPVQSAPENVPQAKEEAAINNGAEEATAHEAAQSAADAGPPLTAEERAAIARGIQEMERAATQARVQRSRR